MRPFAAPMLAVALLGTGTAAAQTPGEGLALRWRAPSECPSEGEVTAAVTRLLGRPLDHLTPARQAVARIRHEGRRWRLRVTVTTGATRRHRALSGETCAEVSDAAALVLALAIDPDAVARAPVPVEPPPAPPSTAVETAPPTPAPAPSPAPAAVSTVSSPGAPPRVAPALRGFARLEALGDLGAQPSLTWGATLVLGLSVRAFRAELSATYFGPQRASARPGDASQGGDFSLAAGAVRGCLGAPLGPVDLGGCAGVELGVQSGAAFGVSRPARGDALWLALPVVATLRRSISRRFGVHVEAGASIPLLRRQFAIEGVGAVFRPAPVTVRASLGAEVTF